MRTLTEAGEFGSAATAEESTRSASILLFAAEPLATRVAEALRREITPHVSIADRQLTCVELLRRQTVELLLLEESVTALHPETAEMLYDAAGAAAVLEVNFGVMELDRVILAARFALRRRKLDLLHAGAAARLELQHGLAAALTGLHLEAQLALRQAGPGQAPALQRLVDLADHVCNQLRADDVRSL